MRNNSAENKDQPAPVGPAFSSSYYRMKELWLISLREMEPEVKRFSRVFFPKYFVHSLIHSSVSADLTPVCRSKPVSPHGRDSQGH